MTFDEFRKNHCWDKDDRYDTCTVCPYHSVYSGCTHPMHPKNKKPIELKEDRNA